MANFQISSDLAIFSILDRIQESARIILVSRLSGVEGSSVKNPINIYILRFYSPIT